MFCPSPRVVESCGSPVPTPEVLMAQAEATRTRGRKAGTRTRKPAPTAGNPEGIALAVAKAALDIP